MSKKKIIILVAIIILVVGFVLSKFGSSNKPRFITQKAELCTITKTVEASGTINPVNTVSVGSTVSGLIQSVYVDYNSEVKKGDILAEIDPRLFQATLEQNLAQISNAQASLDKARAVLSMSEKTYTRYKNLYAKNFIAKSELDQAKSDYDANRAEVNSAIAQIAQYKANYSNAATNLSYTKIIAPVDGTIISREIDVGQPVAASFQAPELFTIAQDLGKMQIEANVSEADIGQVEKGQKVIYLLDGYNNEEFYGEVTQVRLSPTNISNVVTYTVVIDVENEEGKLKPGMSANISILTQEKNDILCVPNEALKFTPETSGQKYQTQGLWVLDSGRPVRVVVESGISDEQNCEIISDELAQGDLVITDMILAPKKSSGFSMVPKMKGPKGGPR